MREWKKEGTEERERGEKGDREGEGEEKGHIIMAGGDSFGEENLIESRN